MIKKMKTDSERLNEDIVLIDRVIERRSVARGERRHSEAIRAHIRQLNAKRDLLLEMYQDAVSRERRSSPKRISS